jgi:ElaB/YqjD/DUF883 family membrane-anchored ribosome-binding protein
MENENDQRFRDKQPDPDGQGSSGSAGAEERGSSTTDLKSLGIDTDRMSEAATDRAGELQRLIIDEVRERPWRALGWAAGIGFVFGIWSAR